jgi:hypothetical protein
MAASSQGGVPGTSTAEVAVATAYARSPQWRELESYVRSLQLHEQLQANRLLQCLVVDMLHRAVAAAGGNVSQAFNMSVSAAEAGEHTLLNGVIIFVICKRVLQLLLTLL